MLFTIVNFIFNAGMVLKFIYIFFLISVFNVVFGQNFNIKGKLLDEKRQSANDSSIILLNADSSVVKGTTADVNSSFILENIPLSNLKGGSNLTFGLILF